MNQPLPLLLIQSILRLSIIGSLVIQPVTQQVIQLPLQLAQKSVMQPVKQLAVPPVISAAMPTRWRGQEFSWPSCTKKTVIKSFSLPNKVWEAGNRGVDLDTTAGDPICAAGDGTVVYLGRIDGITSVSIEHPSGIRTTYQPISPTVGIGNRIVRGQKIGTVGNERNGKLHWGAKTGPREYLDPMKLLYRKIVLKSWDS